MVLKSTLSGTSLISCQADACVDTTIFSFFLHLCVLLILMCIFWVDGCLLIRRTKSNVFFLYPYHLVDIFQGPSLVFFLNEFLAESGVVAVRVAIVCLYPSVSLARLVILYSAYFLGFPSCCFHGAFFLLSGCF